VGVVESAVKYRSIRRNPIHAGRQAMAIPSTHRVSATKSTSAFRRLTFMFAPGWQTLTYKTESTNSHHFEGLVPAAGERLSFAACTHLLLSPLAASILFVGRHDFRQTRPASRIPSAHVFVLSNLCASGVFFVPVVLRARARTVELCGNRPNTVALLYLIGF